MSAGLLCVPIGAGTWTVESRVVGVPDGETITVLDRAKALHKVRLSEIEAPERKQPFSNKSKENRSRLVLDKFVEARCRKKDRYGRDVCKVMRRAGRATRGPRY
jgi:endonuclease YncB( thermonuclease family)